MRETYLTFGAPVLGEDEIDEVVESLRSGWLGTGPKVARFESEFRDYVGARHAIALNSCTAGLHLSMLVADIGPGDEVITTPMTFAATANAIVHAGATPVLVDCDRATALIDPQRVADAVTSRTKAIVPVHLCGRVCDLDALRDIADEHELTIIEDAAHAIESTYGDRKIGAISELTSFSFYVTKNVITGEGGMLTTSRDDWADRVKMLALHGMSRDAWGRYSDEGFKHYQVLYPGHKYNMMDIQAAMGIHQLRRVEANWLRRDAIWQQYVEAFRELPVGLPAPDDDRGRHARHLFTLLIDETDTGLRRDDFIAELHRRNIGTGVHYLGLHLHPYYRDALQLEPEDLPNATWISERTVSLPLSPTMTQRDVDDVVDAVTQVICSARKG
jgi:dTDP-4-amino-4,6-dideoxygalactose transaminase